MGTTIDYYFAVISGFAYLGDTELRSVAKAAGARIVYKPINIARVFEASGTVPPARQSDVRRRNRDNELQRWAKRRGLVLNITPKHWPVPGGLASCAILAAQELNLDPGLLSFPFLRAVWADDLDISQPDVVRQIVMESFPDDGERILTAAGDPTTAEMFDRVTDEAITVGVFGSPTFLIDGEMFFGQDRLDFVAERLGVS